MSHPFRVKRLNVKAFCLTKQDTKNAQKCQILDDKTPKNAFAEIPDETSTRQKKARKRHEIAIK
jgi:hypothetical protein